MTLVTFVSLAGAALLSQPVSAGPIVLQGTDKCLDLDHGQHNGAIHLWDCNGDSNQRWHFDGGHLVSDATGQCVYRNGEVRVDPFKMREPNDYTQFNNGLVTRDCWNPRSERFNPGPPLNWRREGSALWTSVYDRKVCLDAFGDGRGNGTNIIAFECNGGANQRWEFH